MAETLQEKQNAMLEKNANFPKDLVKWKIPKGFRYANAGRKKRNADDAVLVAISVQPCPDELLVGVMEGLRGQGLTMGDALQYRMFIDSITGIRGSDSITRELMNRLFGKVRLVVTKDEGEKDPTTGMTPEQIRGETMKLLKRLDEITKPKKKRKKEVVSEADPSRVEDPAPTPLPQEVVSEPEQ